MTIKELEKLDNKQLQEKLAELRNKTRELRFNLANNQLKDMRAMRANKKDIARILTIMNQRRISQDNPDQKQVAESDK